MRALEVGNELLQVGHRGVVHRSERDGRRAATTSAAAGARTCRAEQSDQDSKNGDGEMPVPGPKIPIAHAASPLSNSPRIANRKTTSDNVVKRQRCQFYHRSV